MDWSQVSRSQWIVVAGTVATLIGSLFAGYGAFEMGGRIRVPSGSSS